jgi:hypothetical protein
VDAGSSHATNGTGYALYLVDIDKERADLAKADLHVDEAIACVAKLALTIARARRRGRDVAEAQRTLRACMACLDQMKAHRSLLAKNIAEASDSGYLVQLRRSE